MQDRLAAARGVRAGVMQRGLHEVVRADGLHPDAGLLAQPHDFIRAAGPQQRVAIGIVEIEDEFDAVEPQRRRQGEFLLPVSRGMRLVAAAILGQQAALHDAKGAGRMRHWCLWAHIFSKRVRAGPIAWTVMPLSPGALAEARHRSCRRGERGSRGPEVGILDQRAQDVPQENMPLLDALGTGGGHAQTRAYSGKAAAAFTGKALHSYR